MTSRARTGNAHRPGWRDKLMQQVILTGHNRRKFKEDCGERRDTVIISGGAIHCLDR